MPASYSCLFLSGLTRKKTLHASLLQQIRATFPARLTSWSYEKSNTCHIPLPSDILELREIDYQTDVLKNNVQHRRACSFLKWTNLLMIGTEMLSGNKSIQRQKES